MYYSSCGLVNFDTYKGGCKFNCVYCSEKRHRRYGFKTGESYKSLESWIKSGCDPIHFGVLSDPFPDIENTLRRTYKAMYFLAESFHPVILTTKSTMVAGGDYYDLLPFLNVVLQVSMVSKDHSIQWESAAPQYRDRFEMLYKLSKRVKRLIVRCQPFMIDYVDEILDVIPAYASSGVHSLLVSGMSLPSKYGLINEWHGNGYVYPADVLKDYLVAIRDCCHSNDVGFLTNEHDFRGMSDSHSCCGQEVFNG